jgi:hypothetical protein
LKESLLGKYLFSRKLIGESYKIYKLNNGKNIKIILIIYLIIFEVFLLEIGFSDRLEFRHKASEERNSCYKTNSFLNVTSREILVFSLHFFGDFDLLEARNSKKELI